MTQNQYFQVLKLFKLQSSINNLHYELSHSFKSRSQKLFQEENLKFQESHDLQLARRFDRIKFSKSFKDLCLNLKKKNQKVISKSLLLYESLLLNEKNQKYLR